MIDLETMDLVATAAIVSIGAVQCDLTTGEIGDTYYRIVNLDKQDKLGRTIDTNTFYWWLSQSDGARSIFSDPGKITLVDMCKSFKKWLESVNNPERLRYWGNGANYDNAIVEHAFKCCNIKFPIPFWNSRDMRTIVGFYPRQLQSDWKRSNLRSGTYHNALDDAKYQVKYCSHILQELGVEELY
jgi:exodeoxyribonuclease VIII